ncbi:uncharacterized protein LTR77_004665 [Saxophila tyrrhenica]|uniref:Uncharacterized protein n=1 Tax=Saxophila tyrrhenica TaxID=1690608 RepID=A0AAV9PA83_9PEZI|nr:hypothetical protein LTR77_004665 [Saxophila tyrrhenica]
MARPTYTKTRLGVTKASHGQSSISIHSQHNNTQPIFDSLSFQYSSTNKPAKQITELMAFQASSTADFESSFPAPKASWSDTEAANSTYLFHGVDDTPGKKAFFIHLEAKPGKEEQVASFLRDINDGVNQEPGTGPWFGNRFSKSTFCIFEAFPDAEARHAHVVGPGGQNFLRLDYLRDALASPAQIYMLDVLHGKFGTMFGEKIAPVSS